MFFVVHRSTNIVFRQLLIQNDKDKGSIVIHLHEIHSISVKLDDERKEINRSFIFKKRRIF